MKTEVPVTAVVLTPTASRVPSFVAWLKPPFAPAVGLIRFLRVEKEPELFGKGPNNAGGISFYNTSGATLVHPDQTGSFYGEYDSPNHQTITSTTEGRSFSSLRMDASRSSAVYGAADAVQPPAMRALVLIRSH